MISTYEHITLETVDEVVEYIQSLSSSFSVRIEVTENDGKRIDAEFRKD